MNHLVDPKTGLYQSHKMMIFLLSMVLFGLSDMVTELIPSISFGPIDIGVSYFAFIPLIFSILLDPFLASLGACVGETVFGDILLGDFSGIGEVESFLQLFLGLLLAGLLVKKPKNKGMLFAGCMLGIGVDQLLSSLVDLTKIWIGVSKATLVPGLPQSAVLLEGIGFLLEMLVTGFLLGFLPLLYLLPRLHGKLEPLMGIPLREERVIREAPPVKAWVRRILWAVILALLAMNFQVISKIKWDNVKLSTLYDVYPNAVLLLILSSVAILILAIFLLIQKPNRLKTAMELPHD